MTASSSLLLCRQCFCLKIIRFIHSDAPRSSCVTTSWPFFTWMILMKSLASAELLQTCGLSLSSWIQYYAMSSRARLISLLQEPCPDRTLLAASSRKSSFFQPGWFHHCFFIFIVKNLHCECCVVVHCVHLSVIWFVCVDSRLRCSPWPLQTLHISHMCWRWTCSHPWTPQNVSSCGCESHTAFPNCFFLPLTLWHTHCFQLGTFDFSVASFPVGSALHCRSPASLKREQSSSVWFLPTCPQPLWCCPSSTPLPHRSFMENSNQASRCQAVITGPTRGI